MNVIYSLQLVLLFHWISGASSLQVSRRREVLWKLLSSLPVSAVSAMPVLPDTAPCQWGQASEQCIGVYKMPPPAALMEISKARTVLQEQREALSNIQAIILSGQLTQGGLEILKVVPAINKAGRSIVVLTEANSVVSTLQSQQLEERLDMVVGTLGQVDVSIGQSLRGEMGSITGAQISILKDLREASNAFDDFLAIAATIRK